VPGGLGPTEDELAAAVSTLHLWRGANRGVTIVAIDGYGASGKSTIADLLCPRTGASLVRTDDFFLPAARHPDAGGTAAESGRLITSFYDLRRLRAEALEPLRAGREAVFHAFDWDRGAGSSVKTRVAPKGLVLVEGVCLAAPELSDLVDRRSLSTRPSQSAWRACGVASPRRTGTGSGCRPRSSTSRPRARRDRSIL